MGKNPSASLKFRAIKHSKVSINVDNEDSEDKRTRIKQVEEKKQQAAEWGLTKFEQGE